jgi:uncharacterized protein YjgD (DUF1641 family)
MRGGAKSIFAELLEKLKSERVTGVINVASARIDTLFDTSLKPKAEDGVTNAVSAAPEVVAKWGSKVCFSFH